MNREVDEQFLQIAREIVATGWTEAEWCGHEADDWVQNDPYHGGFDSTEQAFCFSVYAGNTEYWFQLTLAEMTEVAAGRHRTLVLRAAK